jgi:hypothetical protein
MVNVGDKMRHLAEGMELDSNVLRVNASSAAAQKEWITTKDHQEIRN